MDRRAREIERLEADAARLRAESSAARQRGDAPAAVQALNEALIVEEMAQLLRGGEAWPAKGLPSAPKTVKQTGMTSAQLRDRAGTIGAAKKPRDKFQQALKASKWRSANRYARERLKISPGMLSRYRKGDFDVPDEVAAKILADFGLSIG